MSSERAGMHTSGALNREKVREAILATMGLRAWNESAPESVLDALEACVVPDSRALERERDVIDALYREEQARDAVEAKLARIETEVYGTEKPQNLEAALFMRERVRAILRGDQ